MIPEYCEDAQCEPTEDVFNAESDEPPPDEAPAEEPPAEDGFEAEPEPIGPDVAIPLPDPPGGGMPQPELPPGPGPGPGPAPGPGPGELPETGAPPDEECHPPPGGAPADPLDGRQAFRAQGICPPPPCPGGQHRCPRAEEPFFGECCPPDRQCCDFGQCCEAGSECRPVGRGQRRVCVERCTEFERRCPTPRGAFGQCCTGNRECCDGGLCCEPGASCVPVGGGRACVFVGREELPEAQAPPSVPRCRENERRCPTRIGSDQVGQCCPWGQDCCADGICCSPGIACWFGRICAE
jgi:hypothetical protein